MKRLLTRCLSSFAQTHHAAIVGFYLMDGFVLRVKVAFSIIEDGFREVVGIHRLKFAAGNHLLTTYPNAIYSGIRSTQDE